MKGSLTCAASLEWNTVRTKSSYFWLLTCSENLKADKRKGEVRAHLETNVMENLPVYHGPIGKEEGERRLAQDGRDGCYLVRNSDSVPGVFCLCVL